MIFNFTNKLCQLFHNLNFWQQFDHQKFATEINNNEPSNKENEITSPQIAEIEWVECEDVYKPIEKPIQEFVTERGIDDKKFSQVYIVNTAHSALVEHLKADTRVEHGGILFGNAYNDSEQGIYVEITAAIAAPATMGTGAYLEFTAESWLGIMDYAKAAHPDANIVGWYHSHPNIGVFMSGTDMRTQRAFFHHPWCLSIVCDPIRNQIGYFLGEKAKLVNIVKFS
jgi:proteasome lid subunit RPN8/RPN11